MTEQTKALAPYDRFVNLVKNDQVQERFNAILAKRAPAFMASLVSVVAGSDALQTCDHASILTSAAKAAILNLPIEPSIGYAYIVPYKGKATFILGYKGMIQLALRTSQYYAINAAEIFQGEEVKVDRLTGAIVLNGKRNGDKVIGYVAYFKLKNGFEKFLYMTYDEIHAHAKRYSQSYGRDKSAWTTNEDEMGKKTVLRLLLGKYGLFSIDMQDEDVPADAPLDARFASPDMTVPDFSAAIEGEMHDAEPTQPEQPEQPESATDFPVGTTSDPAPIAQKGAPMTFETAYQMTNRDGKLYGEIPTKDLSHMANSLAKLASRTPEQEDKLLAIQVIMATRQQLNIAAE